MKILIDIDVDGQISAQVLSAAPVEGSTIFGAATEDSAINGGAAPDGEEETDVIALAEPFQFEADAQDGGGAPPEPDSTEPPLEAALQDKPEVIHDAGAGPTNLDPAAPFSETAPPLTIVN